MLIFIGEIDEKLTRILFCLILLIPKIFMGFVILIMLIPFIFHDWAYDVKHPFSKYMLDDLRNWKKHLFSF